MRISSPIIANGVLFSESDQLSSEPVNVTVGKILALIYRLSSYYSYVITNIIIGFLPTHNMAQCPCSRLREISATVGVMMIVMAIFIIAVIVIIVMFCWWR